MSRGGRCSQTVDQVPSEFVVRRVLLLLWRLLDSTPRVGLGYWARQLPVTNMHANVGGPVEKNEWRTHDDDTVQVVSPKSKEVKELVATSSSQRNWRGMGIALLVILVVCALIITAVVLLTPGNEGPRVRGERITLDDILSENFSASLFNGTWISDYEFAFRDDDGTLQVYNAKTRNASMYATNYPFKEVAAIDWSLSEDRKYVLLTHDVFKVFRHSFLAKYSIYDRLKNKITWLTPQEGSNLPLQYAAWSPKGSALVMVYNNDIYYKRSPRDDVSIRVTNTGLEGTVWNGIPDWLYEEEILSSNKALWFSPDGQMLCFATFNDSRVDVMNYIWYGSSEQRYSHIASVRYPKPNATNPSVSLYCYNTSESENLTPILPPIRFQTEDHYFTAVQWVDNQHISVVWTNRAQNLSIITVCSSPFWYCDENQTIESEHGWVNLFTAPIFSGIGNKYFVIMPTKDGSYGAFPQVAMKDSDGVYFLTHGSWEVTNIKAYDEAYKQVYYIAAPDGKPGQRQLYRVAENKTARHKTGECLTCHLGPDCLYFDATFSKENSYYILECLGPGIPKITLQQTRVNKTIAELDTNDALREFVESKAMPQVKTFRVELTTGKEAHVRLLLPPGLREEEITRYPLVVEVYGGPGSQLVSERFKVGYGHYLSSQRDMIYGFIDGRGSGFQGNNMLFEIYRRFGTIEVEDQVTVAQYLVDKLPFIDSNKLAIWGWSYGGYVSAMAMGWDVKAFNCGVSVAPVTNWKYYDTAYTERYMGFPTHADNLYGYEHADVLRRAPFFPNKKFYLIHGTADDNVHFQQSMMLTKALTEANILFRTQVYPDENHTLGSVKRHLYQSIQDFLHDCFREEKKEEIGLQNNGAE